MSDGLFISRSTTTGATPAAPAGRPDIPQGGRRGGFDIPASAPPGGAGLVTRLTRPRFWSAWAAFLDPGLVGCAALIALAFAIMVVGGPVIEWWLAQ